VGLPKGGDTETKQMEMHVTLELQLPRQMVSDINIQ